VDSAIERGDYAFGVFDDHLLVSYIWRAREAAPHSRNIWVRVRHPYNYAYNSYTRPSYRGRRISPALHLFSDGKMYERGFTNRAGFVAVHNAASLAMGKHMGSKIIGYAGYFDWPGRNISFRTPSVKKIGFEFFERMESE
jgi:hypothetical protein